VALFTYDIHLEKTLPDPPADVWRALTDPEILARWLMRNDFKPEEGHQFEFRDKPRFAWDGIVKCKVLDVVPRERLAMAWIGAPDMPPTLVTFLLRPAGEGTTLTFSQAGFRGLKYSLIGRFLKRGWQDMIGNKLPKAIERAEPAPV
jgi:uncharacterized protein YndB with AHSA1/START domain